MRLIIFMNADYGRNLDRDGAPAKAFAEPFCVGDGVEPSGRGPRDRRRRSPARRAPGRKAS
jgi:hypothetical protein